MSFRAVEHAGIREPRTAGAGIKPVYLAKYPGTDVWGFTTDPREAGGAFREYETSGVRGVDTEVTEPETGRLLVRRGAAVLNLSTE